MADDEVTVNMGAPVRDLWPAGHRGPGSEIGTRAMVCLRRGRVPTVGDLTGMAPLDIMDIPLAGPAVLEEVRRVLRLAGLSLKGDNGLTEAEVRARAARLTRGGMRRLQAMKLVRESWPKGEIAPGVTLEVSE